MNLGEILFITGGNGSGKSTLCKCLSLHYTPTDGAIYFGDQKLTTSNLQEARSSISAIYTDYYLFDGIFDSKLSEKKELIAHYLKLLHLEGKLSIGDDGTFSTTKLSSGQRKRVALLAMLLEDRPVCIFDEWAADQDPQYKEIFYFEILRFLKGRNKLVIVISHDDRYFHCADRILVMENGGLEKIIIN